MSLLSLERDQQENDNFGNINYLKQIEEFPPKIINKNNNKNNE